MNEVKQFLDYEGLKLYDELIKKFLTTNNIELNELKLTEDNTLELYYKKGDKPMKLSVDLSQLVTYSEWIEL